MRWLTALLVALLVALSLVLPAQAFGKDGAHQVHVVTWRGLTEAEEGFMAYLRESALAVEFVHFDAASDMGRLERIRAELRAARPDLIYAFGTTVSVVLAGRVGEQDPERHITDIPMVFNIVADPLGAELTSDLGGSGRNITGTSHLVPIATQFNAIQTLGDYAVVGAIYNPLERNSALAIDLLEALMDTAGIRFIARPIPLDDDMPQIAAIDALAEEIAAAGAELVYLPSDSFVITHADAVVSAFHGRGVPTFSATEGPIRDAGALIGIVSNYFTVGRFAGFKAEQILVEGRDPGTIPMETLARFTFLVNLDSMRTLEYYPPLTVLQFAETVTNQEQQNAQALLQ